MKGTAVRWVLLLAVVMVAAVVRGGREGVVSAQGAGEVEYDLVPGWNLVMWRGVRTAVDGADGLGSVVSSIGAVYGFDAARQQWLAWFPGGGAANSLQELEPWQAYFVTSCRCAAGRPSG